MGEAAPDTRVTQALDDAVVPDWLEPVGAAWSRGASIGRFMVLGDLGSGGMGRVLEAYDPELDRRVAIKIVRPARHDPAFQRFRERLLREARATASLAHPNVVTIYEVGELEGGLFVAMERVDGQTLKAWLAAAPRAWRAIVDTFLQVGRGLAAGHAAGLVHRDVKPDNVLVGNDGRVRVIDFGLVGTIEDEPDQPSAAAREGSHLTLTGQMMGTPRYMAPEQFRGEAADARTDGFAFCLCLYEALYGQPAFDTTSVAARARAVAEDPPAPPPAAADVPAWLGALVVQGLARAPADRPAGLAALVAAIEVRLRELDRPPRARWRAVATTAVVAAVGLGVFAATRGAGPARPSCRTAGSRALRDWTAMERDAVQRALGGVEPAAPVVAAFDLRGAAWQAARIEVCEATHVRGAQSGAALDLRMACLDRRLDELGAVIRVVGAGEAATAAAALDAIAGLPPLTRCDDVESLRTPTAAPADVAAQVATVRASLDRVQALHGAGRYAEAHAIAREASIAAAATGHAPAHAEALYWRAVLEERTGSLDDALATTRAAMPLAAAARDDRLAAQLAVMHLNFVGYRRQRPDEAAPLQALTEAAVARAGAPLELRAELANTRGLVAIGAGDLEAAAPILASAVELYTALHGRAHPKVAGARANRAIALDELGRHAEAAEEFRASRDLYAEALGPRHPRVGAASNSLGISLDALGRHAEALAAMRAGLAILRAAHGDDHTDVASAMATLAATLEPDDPGEALALFAQALAIRARVLGPSHPRTAMTLVAYGGLLVGLGRDAEARTALERAQAIYEDVLDADHPERAPLLLHLGVLANRRGDHRAALAACRGARVVDDKTILPGDAARVPAMACEGLALLGAGDEAGAVAVLEPAVALLAPGTPGLTDVEPRTQAAARFGLARALTATRGRSARARALDLARTARAGLTEASADRAAIDGWLRANP